MQRDFLAKLFALCALVEICCSKVTARYAAFFSRRVLGLANDCVSSTGLAITNTQKTIRFTIPEVLSSSPVKR